MTIDPRFAFYFGVWTSVLLLVASGTINFTGALPELWVPIVTKWCAILGTINSAVLTAASGYSSNKQGPMVSVPSALPTSTVVKILLVAFALSFLVAGGSAQAAQLGNLQATGNFAADAKANAATLKQQVEGAAGGVTNAVSNATGNGTLTCDHSLFLNLSPTNVISAIQSCVAKATSDGAKPFLPDVQAALDSATAAKDQPGIACLTPALSIVKAAVGSPAIAAVDAQPASGSTPAVAAVQAVPALLPGPVLIFQKFREFVLAGGPAACKSWATSTISGATTGIL